MPAGAPFIVGAYATTPAPSPAGRQPGGEEAAFYAALRALPACAGYEVPVLAGGVLHAQDEPWLIAQLAAAPKPTCLVLTLIPATMAALAHSPTFGLASTCEGGRAAALALCAQALDAVGRLRAGGAGAVHAVQVHSAPTRAPGASSSAAALQASLETLARWDWGGAKIVLEHCDAAAPAAGAGGEGAGSPPPTITPCKGFLTLEEELVAVQGARAALAGAGAGAGAAAAPLGLCINWARSVLETRNPATALAHISAVVTAHPSLLAGLVFSGCSGSSEGAYGGAWKDSHLPLSCDAGESLLTEERVGEAVRAAAPAAGLAGFYFGSKVTLAGGAAAAPQARADANARVLAAIARGLQQ